MHLRLGEWSVIIAGFAAGALLPAQFLTAEAARLLTIFLSLIAASILPTITLIVGGMTPGARSVKFLTALKEELRATVAALLFIFLLIALAVATLICLYIPLPFNELFPRYLRFIPTAIGQGILVAICGLVVWKFGNIPTAILRTLDVRSDGAIAEARRKTDANADEALKDTGFKTQAGFGAIKTLDEIKKTK